MGWIMNLNQVGCFVAVAEELHFGRAAEKLHLAQPPVSRQVRRLEAELGLDLFDRTTRRVGLTDAGKLLYPEAKELLTQSAALRRRAAQIRSGDGGVLRLGFVDSSSYDVLPTLLRAHSDRWPAVTYELTTMSSDHQAAALSEGEIDVGLARTAGTHDVDATAIVEEPLLLAVGDDHRLGNCETASLRCVVGDRFIGFDRTLSPSLHRELKGWLWSNGITYDPIIEAAEYTTILGLVAAGRGIAIVPSGVTGFRHGRLRYVGIDDAEASTTLMLLTRPSERSPQVLRFIRLVQELFTVATRLS